MKRMNKNIINGVLLTASLVILGACTKNPNSPGVEYTPDMYRSPAIEAYVDYGVVEGREVEKLTNELSSRKPPIGTIPYNSNDTLAAIMMPYPYGAPLNAHETHGIYEIPQDAGAYEAAAEMKNPIPYSEGIVEEGKAIYENFCMHCHGETGEGNGKIAENGFIMGIPSYKDKLKDLSEGQVFYSITYGKGLMGSHASLIDKEERWKVTHYVKLLQNGGEYPTEENMEKEETEDNASEEAVEGEEESPAEETAEEDSETEDEKED